MAVTGGRVRLRIAIWALDYGEALSPQGTRYTICTLARECVIGALHCVFFSLTRLGTYLPYLGVWNMSRASSQIEVGNIFGAVQGKKMPTPSMVLPNSPEFINERCPRDSLQGSHTYEKVIDSTPVNPYCTPPVSKTLSRGQVTSRPLRGDAPSVCEVWCWR